MDNPLVPDWALIKERQKTALLSEEIRDIRKRLAESSRPSSERITEFPSGSLGKKYGTIGTHNASVG